MKALMKVAKGEGNIEIRDMEIPAITHDDWVLIKIKAAGVCGTDLHIWHDQFRYWPPVVLGHEFSGVIVEAGKKVKNYRPGDRVVAEPKNKACGICDVCRQGMIQLCEYRRSPGWGVHGAFTDYIVMPEFLLHRIPDGLSYEIAALAEPMAVCVHEVLERGRVDCQDTVLVTGSGPIGIMGAFVAKSAGAARVIMTGLNAGEYVRFGVARKLGVDHIINVEKEDAVGAVMELTKGRGADMIIETSGSNAAIRQLADMVKTRGRISAVGLNSKEHVDFQWNKAMYKVLDVMFNFSSSYSSWDRGLSLMSNTDKDLASLITHCETIDNWKKVFNDLEQERGIKALFIPEED